MTTTLDRIDLETLMQIYVIANTPTFLLREFRGQPSVQALARSAPAELVAGYNACVTQEPIGAEAAVRAYAVLAALSLADHVPPSTMNELKQSSLTWADEMRDAAFASRRPITIAAATFVQQAPALRVTPIIASPAPASTASTTIVTARGQR